MKKSHRSQPAGDRRAQELTPFEVREQELLKKLRIRETLKDQILNALPFTIFLEDEQGRVIFANQYATDLFGLSVNDMQGRTKYDLFAPAYSERLKQDDREIWRSRTPVTKEEPFRYKGKEQYVFTGKTILSADEEPGEDYLLGFSIDITARVQAEELLRESEERFRKLVDQAADSFFIIDMQGHITDVNDEACRMLGYSREALLSLHLDAISSLSPEERQHVMDRVARGETTNVEEAMIKQDGSTVPVEMKLGLIRMRDQDVVLALARDITERIKAQDRIKHMADHDFLTGLPNRRFVMRKSKKLFHPDPSDKACHAVLMLDLDHFKVINDSLGHQAGDRLLQLVAGRLKSCIRDQDLLARLGGDEFLLLVPHLSSEEEAFRIGESIVQALSAPFTIQDQAVTVSTSIGISLYPDHGADVHTVLKHADIAMYHSKLKGRNGFSLFDDSMLQPANRRMFIETVLRQALEDGSFFIQYQPKIDLATGRVSGFEALVRCRDPQGVILDPDSFIPVAEETGIIVPLGEWILHEACSQCRQWNELGFGPLSVSVNFSARQFQNRNIEERIMGILQETALPPHLLELELTESTVMYKPAEAVKILKSFKSLGVKIAIDDFGTGFSSMSYLKDFPIDALKIDQSFIQSIPNDKACSAITHALISLAGSLELTVVAEGVETREQLDVLIDGGCDLVQGYYYSHPLDQDAVAGFLKAWTRG